MPTPLAVAVFFTVWWVSLFAVLPFFARSPEEAGETQLPPGVEPGAPVKPRLALAALWTTGLAAAVFLVIDAFAFWMG
ncbi:MAG: DUF1467 family protein [Bradyrhizobium sp.]|nr:MAG: DUF1467 family protein [Bradyrhizobium sp.]